MEYNIGNLAADVMARMGEKHPGSDAMPFPTIADAVELKVKGLLPAVGKRLIADAPVMECGWVANSAPYAGSDVEMHKMPCGLYACDIPLPEGTVRILSVRMGSWLRSVEHIIMPEEPEWKCQWSVEAGIAGSPDGPRAYLIQGDCLRIRCIGSESAEDAPESVILRRMPDPDEEGKFDFPAALYPELISEIVKELGRL